MKSLRYIEEEHAWLATFIIVHVIKGAVIMIIIYILMMEQFVTYKTNEYCHS